jgi:hypothetical protein
MSSKKKGGGQEGALAKMLERQTVCVCQGGQQAAADAAKKLKDATKEAEEAARVAAAQAAHEEAQVCDDESTLPHLPFGRFWLRLKKEKKYILKI